MEYRDWMVGQCRECVGLGGGSPLMQNGLGIGAEGDCGEDCGEGESGFCGHINVTQHSGDRKRQDNPIPLPTPTHKHRYFFYTWLPFAIIL